VVAQQDGWTTVEAPLAHDVDPRDAAWAELAAMQVPVRELTLALPTLEQFFAQVTEGPAEEATA
jgi:hypothetical protein